MKYIFTLILIISCKTAIYNSNTFDDNKILNIIIKDDIILNKEKIKIIFLDNSLSKKPNFYLKSYNKWKNAYTKNKKTFIQLNGEVNWIFSKKEIKNMIKKYDDWKKTEWNKKYTLSEDVKWIREIPRIYKNNMYKISQPLYNHNKLKALLFIEKYEKQKHIFSRMLILKKEEDNWKISNSVFMSYY